MILPSPIIETSLDSMHTKSISFGRGAMLRPLKQQPLQQRYDNASRQQRHARIAPRASG